MRKALIAAMAALAAGAAGLGAGYYLWGIPTDWYAVDVAKLGEAPENDLIRYGRELIVDTPRYIGKSAIDPAMRYAVTTCPARTAI
jgi:thiosulfate dehydrogenase